MALVRTAVAYCDHMGCSMYLRLDPSAIFDTRLTKEGWGVYLEKTEMKTYCPVHTEVRDR